MQYRSQSAAVPAARVHGIDFLTRYSLKTTPTSQPQLSFSHLLARSQPRKFHVASPRLSLMTVWQILNATACQGDNAAIDSALCIININSSAFNSPNSLYTVEV
jgi:hypothetical protein